MFLYSIYYSFIRRDKLMYHIYTLLLSSVVETFCRIDEVMYDSRRTFSNFQYHS